MKLVNYLVFIALSCNSVVNSSDNKESMDIKNPTIKNEIGISAEDSISILKPTSNKESAILVLDDNNTLVIDSLNIQIIINENKDESYNLLVKRFKKNILKKENIAGISKIFLNENFIMFSIYTVFDEDGNNEGYPLLFDLKRNEIKLDNKILTNTCNPFFKDNQIYLVDNLSLIKSDINFNKNKIINIEFINKENSFDYLDSFLICAIDITNSNLKINFTPIKSKPCIIFEGEFSENSTKIQLNDSN